MKRIIILGDGMADHPIARLGNKTLLQYADKPCMDRLADMGKTGRLITIPEGFPPGSEVANTAIMGYDLNEVYEGRGPLEAASIGYEMTTEDLALRCNLITLQDDIILTHNGGNLMTKDAEGLIHELNLRLGNDKIRFITGIQYRHLLVVKGGSKHIICAPPHDHPNDPWRALLVQPEPGWEDKKEEYTDENGDRHERMTARETAALLNDLIISSQQFLPELPYNRMRIRQGERPANSIWPWSGGYRPKMHTLMEQYPQIHSGSVISAVDLIKGIGHYAGLDIIEVEGATGLADTNYEGKAAAAIDALRKQDFVFVHVEATDEAGHDGDLELKLKAINYLDQRLIAPIVKETESWDEPVCIAILPDHPTPVEMRIHISEPVPFLIYYPGIKSDEVNTYDEYSCVKGDFGLLKLNEFMQLFMTIGEKEYQDNI
ncbi:MAG: cofactor-independent phosphoglycerate mutase [Prevotella sp.]|nr:cofactor-independent phosphoglycerate mutase [Prevotella sp.]